MNIGQAFVGGLSSCPIAITKDHRDPYPKRRYVQVLKLVQFVLATLILTINPQTEEAGLSTMQGYYVIRAIQIGASDFGKYL